MRHTPPSAAYEVLTSCGWSAAEGLDLDALESAEKIFEGTPTGEWAAQVVAAAYRKMPPTSGVGFLDDRAHLVGVGLESGDVVGRQTERVVTDLDRADACFTMRALEQGFASVRPMPLAPVALFNLDAGTGLDGTRFLQDETLVAAALANLPAEARIFAETDPENRTTIYDLWAVSPSTSPGGIGIWRRHNGKWMDDPGWLATLRGENPPSLVHLPTDSPVVQDLIQQVDRSTAGKKFDPLVAAIVASPEFYTDLLPLVAARRSRGGLAKASGVGKGGNAETLRRYWAEGKGAAKIRWGTGGDWYRCTRQLRKYMGVRAKGYCNLLHKRVLGFYPSTHAAMIKGAKKHAG